MEAQALVLVHVGLLATRSLAQCPTASITMAVVVVLGMVRTLLRLLGNGCHSKNIPAGRLVIRRIMLVVVLGENVDRLGSRSCCCGYRGSWCLLVALGVGKVQDRLGSNCHTAVHRAASAKIHAAHKLVVKDNLNLQTVNANNSSLGADGYSSRVLDKNDAVAKLKSLVGQQRCGVAGLEHSVATQVLDNDVLHSRPRLNILVCCLLHQRNRVL